jgi:sugar O-acyltransferase (sialic acid O-acetyltransferase NeuD family)
MSRVAVLRGGGRHAAVVWEQIVCMYKDVQVWDDATDDADLHPLLRPLPRFDLNNLKSDSDDGRSISSIDCFVAVGSPNVRKILVEQVKESSLLSIYFPTVVHKTAVIADTAQIGIGCFIGPQALVNTNARVGDFCLINSAAIVEHDCRLGDYATLNPGAILLGSVVMESLATLGANASVRENRSVMTEAIVGMGAAVVRDINGPLNGFWGGVPARPISRMAVSNEAHQIRWCLKKSFSLDRYAQYLHCSLEKGHLTNDGPLQSVLQSKVKNLVRSNQEVLLSSNGTAALHALVAGLELRKGRHLRWVTQAFTFPSSIQGPLSDAFVCDIDENLQGPCIRYLNERKATFDGVIVTNCFGYQTEILAYEKWCIQNEKFLIFDNAATPLGFVEDGRCIHDVGDGAFISFHETKPFGRGEGGAIFTGTDIAPFVHQAMNFGYDIPNQVRIPNRYSSNWRMSDFAAAAICDHIDNIVSEKWEDKLNALTCFAAEELGKRGYKMALTLRYPTILSCLFVDLGNQPGGAICRQLNSPGTEAKRYYCPLVDRTAAPRAWELYDRSVCLPFHLGISREQLLCVFEQLG